MNRKCAKKTWNGGHKVLASVMHARRRSNKGGAERTRNIHDPENSAFYAVSMNRRSEAPRMLARAEAVLLHAGGRKILRTAGLWAERARPQKSRCGARASRR